MNTHVDKTQENKSQSVANTVSQKQSGSESAFQFVDNRPETVAQRKLQQLAHIRSQAQPIAQLSGIANQGVVQRVKQKDVSKEEWTVLISMAFQIYARKHLGCTAYDQIVYRRWLDKVSVENAKKYVADFKADLAKSEEEKKSTRDAKLATQQPQKKGANTNFATKKRLPAQKDPLVGGSEKEEDDGDAQEEQTVATSAAKKPPKKTITEHATKQQAQMLNDPKFLGFLAPISKKDGLMIKVWFKSLTKEEAAQLLHDYWKAEGVKLAQEQVQEVKDEKERKEAEEKRKLEEHLAREAKMKPDAKTIREGLNQRIFTAEKHAKSPGKSPDHPQPSFFGMTEEELQGLKERTRPTHAEREDGQVAEKRAITRHSGAEMELGTLPFTHNTSPGGLLGMLGADKMLSTVENSVNFRYGLDSRYFEGVSLVMRDQMEWCWNQTYLQDLYKQHEALTGRTQPPQTPGTEHDFSYGLEKRNRNPVKNEGYQVSRRITREVDKVTDFRHRQIAAATGNKSFKLSALKSFELVEEKDIQIYKRFTELNKSISQTPQQIKAAEARVKEIEGDDRLKSFSTYEAGLAEAKEKVEELKRKLDMEVKMLEELELPPAVKAKIEQFRKQASLAVVNPQLRVPIKASGSHNNEISPTAHIDFVLITSSAARELIETLYDDTMDKVGKKSDEVSTGAGHPKTFKKDAALSNFLTLLQSNRVLVVPDHGEFYIGRSDSTQAQKKSGKAPKLKPQEEKEMADREKRDLHAAKHGMNFHPAFQHYDGTPPNNNTQGAARLATFFELEKAFYARLAQSKDDRGNPHLAAALSERLLQQLTRAPEDQLPTATITTDSQKGPESKDKAMLPPPEVQLATMPSVQPPSLALAAYLTHLEGDWDQGAMAQHVPQPGHGQGVLVHQVEANDPEEHLPEHNPEQEVKELRPHNISVSTNGGRGALCFIYSIVMGLTGASEGSIHNLVREIAQKAGIQGGWIAIDSEEAKRVIAIISGMAGTEINLVELQRSAQGYIISGRAGSPGGHLVVIRLTPGHYDAFTG